MSVKMREMHMLRLCDNVVLGHTLLVRLTQEGNDSGITVEQLAETSEDATGNGPSGVTDKKLVAEQIIEEFGLKHNEEQERVFCLLLMFLTGIGGSRKIEFFRRCGAAKRLTLMVLINGYTIHSLTFLPKRPMWRTASLMSTELLSEVSWDESVTFKPFGDIGQLRPPKSNAVYRLATAQSVHRQTALHGAFLWQQVGKVVELKQNWHAKEDPVFVAMLECIRKGHARRIASDDGTQHSPDEFADFCNLLRDVQYAIQTTQPFFMYHAQDEVSGKAATAEQQERLWQVTMTDCHDALGMPVMITENTATSCKVYEINELNRRYAGLAVEIEGLASMIVPIFPTAVSFSFVAGDKTFTVRRTQLPLLPGWVFTDFKVQGSSLTKVIVDLTCAKSLQSIYVMLLRAPKLNGIVVLRWFSSQWLNSDLQADAREELRHLELLDNETKLYCAARKM
ncbi:uncharacterized protein EDB91DRAFT_1239688 [Suillus paluster]|uniref:uncharacterized protein n=1 Tax=Suillus paluster TaxID=48578 RepID=UPI001B877AFC|nr:uncharacterized protein EDB91DRAFT_1239688 [Suillus paluster]KAG1726070.1 hypothetical protein EDB91DRAFT_1239688 [Suillus paluster]